MAVLLGAALVRETLLQSAAGRQTLRQSHALIQLTLATVSVRQTLNVLFITSYLEFTDLFFHMCLWSTKAVISNTGIFVAIANNTLYGSKL